MPPIRGHGRNQRDGRVRKHPFSTTKSKASTQHRRFHGAQNSMSTTINFSVEVPSARGEDWRVYSSDEKEDGVHDIEQLPDRSLSTTDPKSESTDNTPTQKATHPNQARPDPNGLTSTHAQDDVPHRKRKVEVGQAENLVDRKSHHSVRKRSSLTIQLAKAAKSDSNARWKVKKRLELSKAWPSLTVAEQEERKEAAIEELMRQRFINRQSREYFESILEEEASYDEKPTYPRAQPEGEDGTTLKGNPNHGVAQPTESSASQDVHELTIPEPLEAESHSHDTMPRIGYIARSEFENYVFLAAFVRHAPNDVKLDFDAIAQELQIPQETVIARLRELKTRLTEQGPDLGNSPWTDGLAAFPADAQNHSSGGFAGGEATHRPGSV